MNKTYTVKKGDTLYGISNQFGVSVSQLLKANNLNSNAIIRVGQVLNIPTTTGTNPDTTFSYIVKKGDSLYKIAQKYNTTVSKLKELNNLTTNNLAINQVLLIPETLSNQNDLTVPNYTNYTVKKGDSLYKIAQKYNTSVDTIIKDNNLSSSVLKIGQNLKIRLLVDEVEECFGEDYVSPSDNVVEYTVKKGDSLYRIAQRFNTSVDSIKRKNNLKSNLLSIGQKLII